MFPVHLVLLSCNLTQSFLFSLMLKSHSNMRKLNQRALERNLSWSMSFWVVDANAIWNLLSFVISCCLSWSIVRDALHLLYGWFLLYFYSLNWLLDLKGFCFFSFVFPLRTSAHYCPFCVSSNENRSPALPDVVCSK